MIEDDDGVVARQCRDVVGEIFLGSTETVDEKQPRTFARHLDCQPDPVARRDPHAPMVARSPEVAPPPAAHPTPQPVSAAFSWDS